MPVTDLPIEDIRQSLAQELSKQTRFILKAPTGSGKSTQCPQMLIDEKLVKEGQVIVMQPRRIAARMLATRVAKEREVKCGYEVGYQVRFDNKSNKSTRILYLTEGILLRRMLEDPNLKGVSALLFDEFHERHIYGDVSLAQALKIQKTQRPDLIIGVMSATLESKELTDFLTPCAQLESQGRTFPVEIRYSAGDKTGREKPVWERAALQFNKLAKESEGDFLIFMPGAFEINRTIYELEKQSMAKDFDIMALHGDLTPEKQDNAVKKGTRRKVIVSTNVAETSLTIPGVKIVIDSGLARIPSFDANRGINTLLVKNISQASAEQRAGRAGRESSGICMRLWGQNEHKHRSPFEAPEIHRLDLAEIALTLKNSGIDKLDEFPWFEAPTRRHLERAESLLMDLAALNSKGELSELGKRMNSFPLHPRYSRLFLEASKRGCLQAATIIAAISQGRPLLLKLHDKRLREKREDILGLDKELQSDHFANLAAWQLAASQKFNHKFCKEWGIHGQAARQAAQLAEQFLRTAQKQGLSIENKEASNLTELRKCLLAAFSDQLAIRLDKGTNRCAIVHGRKGEKRKESLVKSRLFVSSEIEERNLRGEVQTMLAINTGIEETWLKELFPKDFSSSDGVYYDSSAKRVRNVKSQKFRDLILEELENDTVPMDEAAKLLANEIDQGRIALKRWNEDVENWITRVNFVAQHFPEYEIEPIAENERKMIIEDICFGSLSAKEIRDKEVFPKLKEWLFKEQLPLIDNCAPNRVKINERFSAKIRYENDGRAFLSARVQQLYDTKAVKLGDRVPVIYEILAPNQRPVQLTSDLEAFWKTSYPQIKKDLKGRYPKHEWR